MDPFDLQEVALQAADKKRMLSPDPIFEVPVRAHLFSRALKRLGSPGPRKVLRDLGGAIFWQVVSKVMQITGAAYAARCLGAANLGLSGTVIVVATITQLILDLGLDIVAVRHAAARTARLPEVASALFTVRLCLALGTAAIWIVAVCLAPLAGEVRWVWALGAPFMVTLVMSFGWFYQATERLPRLALIQTLISTSVSLYYLVAFRPNQEVGSDLAVMVVVNALAGAAVWWQIQRTNEFPLLAFRHLRHAGQLIREAMPNWLFNLTYYLMAMMGLPLLYLLSNDARETGLYRSALLLATSLQTVLQYFCLVLIPRIVAWRNFESSRFRRRVLMIIAGVCGVGVAAASAVWLMQHSLYYLIYGKEFMPAAGLFPILLLAKFFSMATAISVWALFAERRDWLAVKCCFGPLAVSFVLHLLLLPRYGMTAAAWLNCGAEACLAGICLLAFCRVNSHPKSATSAS